MLLRWFLVNGTPNEQMFNQSKIRERIALERSKIETLFFINFLFSYRLLSLLFSPFPVFGLTEIFRQCVAKASKLERGTFSVTKQGRSVRFCK